MCGFKKRSAYALTLSEDVCERIDKVFFLSYRGRADKNKRIYAMSTAYAQEAAAPMMMGGGMIDILFMVAFVAILWFMLIRPQNQRMKAHQALTASLKRGDKVVTDSGIYGTILKVVDEGKVEIEIAKDTKVTVVRNAVAAIVDEKSKEK